VQLGAHRFKEPSLELKNTLAKCQRFDQDDQFWWAICCNAHCTKECQSFRLDCKRTKTIPEE
jgi:hypothetical protein